MAQFQKNLEQALRAEGAAMVGFADLRGIPEGVREGLPFGIAIAVNLRPDIIAGISSGPTMEYHEEYKRANTLLAHLTAQAGSILRNAGYQAAFGRPTVSGAELGEGLGTPLPHKTVATRAGLGWVGKCALLVTTEYGSAIRLASVLTDAPVSPAHPVDDSQCNQCRACVETCPAQAVTGENWAAGQPRETILDAALCRSTARELAATGGIDETICGICIAACPFTRRYLRLSQAAVPGACDPRTH